MKELIHRITWHQVEWINAIKTGVAATLSIIAGNILDQLIGHPTNMITILWCTLTAIVVLQARLGGTYKEAIRQLMGIAIGSTIGCISAALFPAPPTAITIGISVSLAIVICSMLGIKESIRIAAISTAIILIIWGMHSETPPWEFGFYRFLNSATGVAVAVAVAHLLWPIQATEKMRTEIADMLVSLKNLFIYLCNVSVEHEERQRHTTDLINTFIHQLDRSHLFLEETQMELSAKVSTNLYELLLHRLEHLFDTITILAKLDERRLKAMYDTPLEEATKELFNQMVVMFEQLIVHLQTRQPVHEPPPLAHALENIYEERMRFRRNQTLRNFSLNDVEAFFVYFHTLRMIAEQLMRIHASTKEAIPEP